MPIKKYTADADNTIVNAFQQDLQTRATGANAGAADIVEVYSVFGRQSSGSQELSRVLMQFPVTSMSNWVFMKHCQGPGRHGHRRT